MNTIVLYHGSQFIIDEPEYGKGKLHNDYGRGFYCTRHKELAKEWAVSENINGYVNSYEISMSLLKVLDLRNDRYSILHWLALLLANREFSVRTPVALRGKQYILENYLIDITEYDLIIGYRADDSYFSFARDFINNTISVEQLSYAMKLGELKEQYVLVSNKAFEHITYIDSEPVSSFEYYPKRKQRDEKARKAYFDQLNETNISGIYIRDLINGVPLNEKSL